MLHRPHWWHPVGDPRRRRGSQARHTKVDPGAESTTHVPHRGRNQGACAVCGSLDAGLGGFDAAGALTTRAGVCASVPYYVGSTCGKLWFAVPLLLSVCSMQACDTQSDLCVVSGDRCCHAAQPLHFMPHIPPAAPCPIGSSTLPCLGSPVAPGTLPLVVPWPHISWQHAPRLIPHYVRQLLVTLTYTNTILCLCCIHRCVSVTL